MKSWLLQALFDLRYSYWFIPTMMAIAAIGFAILMVSLDVYVLTEIPAGYEWLFRSQPSGARAILSTVAGSTITVAGVVFSMTIMSVSHATSNYGSRLLLKFLKDRRNQIALGTFTATFIYCLLVLRTVSSADLGAGSNDFVPHLAVLGSLAMALASVAVLIAFIHHVPDSIHIGEVASDRGRELVDRLDEAFPPLGADNAKDGEPTDVSLSLSAAPSTQVLSLCSGYLQTLDVDGLLNYCTEHKLVANVVKACGDYIFEGEVILEIARSHESEEHQAEHNLVKFFGIGTERTPAQDTRFLVEELTQVAVRALSPGINDPYTAITCIDWLGNALAHVIDKPARNNKLRDEQQILRLILPAFSFEDLCSLIFDQLRPYVTNDVSTSLHIAKVASNILSCSHESAQQQLLKEHVQAFAIESQAACQSQADQNRLQLAYGEILE